MTTIAGIALGVVVKKTGKPPRFPPAYGTYLEKIAESVGIDRQKLVMLTGLDYNTIYRNFTGKPQRSMLAANKIRKVLIDKGAVVDPVPSEDDGWEPGKAKAPVVDDDPMRRNLVNFREEAGLGLHEAAAATGVPLETLKAYELGTVIVPSLHLIRLAEAYGRPAEHFAREDPPARDRKPPPRVGIHAFEVDSMTPEHRARVLEIQRELERINDAERARAEQGKKGKR